MSTSEYEMLQQDYQKLLSQHYSTKQSLEAQIETLKTENRKLRDESQGRGLWAIAMTALLLMSAILFGFLR